MRRTATASAAGLAGLGLGGSMGGQPQSHGHGEQQQPQHKPLGKGKGSSIFSTDTHGRDDLRYFGKTLTDPINTAETKGLVKQHIDSPPQAEDVQRALPMSSRRTSVACATLRTPARSAWTLSTCVASRSSSSATLEIGRMPIMLKSSRCVLTNKFPDEIAALGECPSTQVFRGYFIIRGVEKVILIQEQLSKNRIIVETDRTGCIGANVTSSTHEKKSKTGVVYGKTGKMVLKHNSLTAEVPISVIMKAMGIDSFVADDLEYLALFSPSLEEAAGLKISTQRQASRVHCGKVKMTIKPGRFGARRDLLEEARDLLATTVLAHVPVDSDDAGNLNFRPKAIYVAIMVRRTLQAVKDGGIVDDRDFIGNKRLELAGQLLSLLFEDLFKSWTMAIKRAVDSQLKRTNRTTQYDACRCHGLFRSISSGNWNVKRFKMERAGVTQVLSRLSYVSALGMLTRISSQFEKTRKVAGPRSLQTSQWGMLCPSDTPEGEACGLIKNLALMTHITTDSDDNLRRTGRVSAYVSVYRTVSQRTINISSDGGRVCRPLIIVERGVPKVTENDVRDIIHGVRRFDDLVASGKVEFLDTNEETDSDIAGTGTRGHHCSLHGAWRVCHGQAGDWHNRIQPAHAHRHAPVPHGVPAAPMLIGFDKVPAGQNATVAVMSYSGYDIEDALVLNKASVDRGYGRCQVMRKASTMIKSYANQTFDRLADPVMDPVTGVVQERFRALDYDGMAAVGERVYTGNIIVNKQSPVETSPRVATAGGGAGDDDDDPAALMMARAGALDPSAIPFKNTPLSFKYPGDAVVDQEDQTLIKLGDKGVCGIIVNQEDMPFAENGVVPDVIMNPHGFPSRMTVGKMIELLAGKAGLFAGKVHDMSRILVEAGYSYSGKDYLTSGITGEPLQAYIFFGPVYYQKLKHMVMDKMHARSRGPRATLTRQPTEGRSRDGGLRVGEMERDCLIGHGASSLLIERLLFSSDAYDVEVCSKCGLVGAWHGFCPFCKSRSGVVSVKMPYACKLLFQELMSMNVVPRVQVADLE
ncbi:hypothetical protein BC831DRAFT_448884 [Entophlyctis helioformis]|nr:hypothetical protein BC831DRAFT_448884 [Entophlyctis helioformis]